eukprot:Opistho-2@25745
MSGGHKHCICFVFIALTITIIERGEMLRQLLSTLATRIAARGSVRAHFDCANFSTLSTVAKMSGYVRQDSAFGNTDEPIDERMKFYEGQYASFLHEDMCWMVRLDGHKFSKYTAGFNKPFDTRINEALVLTTVDLCRNFSPTFAFCQSDEITLVFPKLTRKKEDSSCLPFAGRVSKILSLAASYCSVRFYYHMSKQKYDPETEAKLIEKVSSGISHFDARIFHLPSEREAVENIWWRSMLDGQRNSVSMLGQTHFNAKKLLRYPTEKILAELRSIGHPWEAYPPQFKYGAFFKRESFDHSGVNPITGVVTPCVRNRLAAFSFAMSDISALPNGENALTQLLFARNWQDTGFDYEAIGTLIGRWSMTNGT